MKNSTSIKLAQLLMLLSVGAISANVMLSSKASDFWATDKYVDASSNHAKNAARILDPKSIDPGDVNDDKDLDGLVMVVSSFETVVHAEPSVASQAIGIFEMGDAVRVTDALDYYRIPESSWMDEMGEKAEFTPTWVRIKTPKIEGYVSARSLADPERYLQVSASDAQENVTGQGEEAVGGFTSKVKKKKINVAKGVAGAPQREGSDYELIQKIVDDSTGALDFYRTVIAADDALNSDCGMTIEELDPVLAKELEEKSNSSSGFAMPGNNKPKPKEEKKPKPKEEKKPKNPFGGGIPNPFGGIGEFPNPFGGGKKPKGGGKDPLGGLGDIAGKAGDLGKIMEIVDLLTQERLATPLEEFYLGVECAAASTNNAPRLLADDPISKYVVEIGHKVAANSTMPYPVGGYKFVVLKDEEYQNALAAPGGFIFMTTSMLNLLESEDQLAVILGHEIAHCEERHGMLAVNKSDSPFGMAMGVFGLFQDELIDDILDDMLKGMDDIPLGFQGMIKEKLREVATDGFNAAIASAVDAIDKPSTAAESAADERGMSLACAAGYDPKAMLGTLEALKKIEHYDEAHTKGYSPTRTADVTKLLDLLPRSVHDSEEGKQKKAERTARFNSIVKKP